jgi:hypothetical protein
LNETEDGRARAQAADAIIMMAPGETAVRGLYTCRLALVLRGQGFE